MDPVRKGTMRNRYAPVGELSDLEEKAKAIGAEPPEDFLEVNMVGSSKEVIEGWPIKLFCTQPGLDFRPFRGIQRRRESGRTPEVVLALESREGSQVPLDDVWHTAANDGFEVVV